MIYPRLRLSKRFLAQDGVILVSIDDAEQASLRRLMDEVFGEQNFIAQLVWEKGRKNDAKFFSLGHEYVLVYAKSKATLRERKTNGAKRSPAHVRSGTSTSASVSCTAPMTLRSRRISRLGSQRYRREIPRRSGRGTSAVDVNGPWRDPDISWPAATDRPTT